MANENDKTDRPLYGAVGALQNAVENIDKRLDRFEQTVLHRLDKQDEKYEAGKERAQAFQIRMEERDKENMKKVEYESAGKIQWLYENWHLIAIIIGALSVLGVLTYSDKFKDIFGTTETVDKITGGKKSEGRR